LKVLKNEQGYALVTVLLIVTIFMILSLSFMGQAFSSTKQNQVFEKNTRSVSAAEMGVSYYQVEIQRLFETKQTEVTNIVKGITGPNPPSTTNIKRIATEKMAEEIQKDITITNIPGPISVEGHPNANFKIENFRAIPATDVTVNIVNISFDILGYEEGKETKLSAKMSLDLGTISKQTSATTTEKVMPTFDEIGIPSNGCTSFATAGCSNGINVTGKYLTSQTNGIAMSGKTIYSSDPDGSVNVNHNANGSTGLNIHAEGPITVDKNMNSSSDLTMETKSNLTFLGQIRLDTTSRILVKYDLINYDYDDDDENDDDESNGSSGSNGQNGNHLTLDNSFVYVGQDAYVNKLSVSNFSKMCVNRHLYVYSSKDIDTTSNLYVKGNVYNWVKGTGNTYSWQQVVGDGGTSDNVFLAQCGSTPPSTYQINWPNDIYTEIDVVEY
jgi:hypothetical protein